MIRVELTEGEARALIGADVPEGFSGEYPYWLLERAQLNVQRATHGLGRLNNTDDARPPLPANARRIVMYQPAEERT